MKAKEIINQWNSMSDEQKLSMCENCVKRAIKQGRKLKAGYDFDDAVQSTAERVLKVLKNPAKPDADTEQRESKAISQTITNEDGEELDVLNIIAAKANTEEIVIVPLLLSLLRPMVFILPPASTNFHLSQKDGAGAAFAVSCTHPPLTSGTFRCKSVKPCKTNSLPGQGAASWPGVKV